MPPPLRNASLDIEALSGILGSISIACWVVVFTPQIVENFRRSSADGLSLVFIVIWLLGDVFNILGALLQGVLPTMIILAVYYTLADIVLLLQCFYYRGFTLSDAPSRSREQQQKDDVAVANGHSSGHNGAIGGGENGHAAGDEHDQRVHYYYDDDDPDEDSPLLNRVDTPPSSTYYHTHALSAGSADNNANGHGHRSHRRRRDSLASFRSVLSGTSAHIGGVHSAHLSPATPLLLQHEHRAAADGDNDAPAARNLKPTSTLQALAFNTTALLLVCAAGAFGWWLSASGGGGGGGGGRHHHHHQQKHNNSLLSSFTLTKSRPADDTDTATLDFDAWGQAFGYLCALFYLGSRIPQLLLNYRRKSTEGVSMLFFLFACVGNLTYVLSIFAYEPPCARGAVGATSASAGGLSGAAAAVARGCADGEFAAQYARYVLVNLSWLIGSAGTLFLDAGIFLQFWIYRGRLAGDASSPPETDGAAPAAGTAVAVADS